MKTLVFASNPILQSSTQSPICKPQKFPFSQPNTSKQLNYQFTTLKPQASAKGFSNTRPPSTNKAKDDVPIKKNPNNKNDDDDIPKEVMYRIIGRILFSTLVPMALGLSFLHLYGELKDRHIFNAPLWMPFVTTLVFFGASGLGIAYGVLSTSLDAEREGSLLGFEEVEKNWDEMWQQENVSDD
ncbi:hypothetical protein MtrunA17_Chr6g0469701 [Medicago truncatula]|uniref:Transmembrane protein, putative n=1 Tax=Medicago truncatula TaxID=3880 RepID=A0A072UKD7_MEDTR|nr:uncharacterized protein PAM68-like [Medicago truncatula]KEH26295.1 transmembrane protein, putative [Medicago truncatula]RHN51533.1 hypothetical protein MtrunA17_Chr6g0469701 [Medicago truncatula]